MQGKRVVAELGCGVGNTIFPLIKEHPHLFFYGLDFAPSAIELVKVRTWDLHDPASCTFHTRAFSAFVHAQNNPEYDESRIKAYVCDITDDASWPSDIRDGSVDLVTMIFVLSAISPGILPSPPSSPRRLIRLLAGALPAYLCVQRKCPTWCAMWHGYESLLHPTPSPSARCLESADSISSVLCAADSQTRRAGPVSVSQPMLCSRAI